MVAMCNQSTSDTPVLLHCQCLSHPFSTTTTILRRERRDHFYQFSSLSLGFAFEDHDELAPARITDAFPQVMVLDHHFDIQVFHNYHPELINQSPRRFVMKVSALPFDFQMLPGQQQDCLLTPLTASLTSRDLALRGLQSPLGNPQMLGIFDY